MTGSHSVLLRAELGLTAVTVAAVVGMGRLFDGNRWFWPLVVNAVLAHITMAVSRRRGLNLLTTLLAAAPATVLAISWTCYWSTTTAAVPTGETWAAMSRDLDDAWTLYQEVVAPAPVLTGFLLVSAVAIWGVAYVADWAAFRLWVPFEATLAAGTLFLFTALLGSDKGREGAVGVFAAAVIGFILLHRMARQDGTSHWVADRRERGHRWLLAAGGGLGAVAVLGGTLLGPNLPGAGSRGVLDPRALRNEDARITISPLVDIRTRLVQQSDLEVFQVRSPEPSYWRLTSLERFDGRIWSSSGSYAEADDDLPVSYETSAATATFDQTFAISALAQIWLPGAFEPRSLTIEGVDIRYDEKSATLIVDRDVESSDSLVYTVTSSSPRITPADLAGSAGEVPSDIVAAFTHLEDDFSPEVRELAESITVRATNPYEAALALQEHLRGFTYDLTANAGHSDDHLRDFLLETKRGYCEQFAGSFAAMARAIGLPARVAVGFTQGERDPSDPTLFRVRGEHAHAWPEVFFAGAGWVAFEPTPGRGMPFAESYTGVQPAQAQSGNPGGVDTAPATTEAPAVTAPTPTLPPEDGQIPDNVADTPADAGGGGGEAESWFDRYVLRPLLYLLAAVTITGLLYAMCFPTAMWLSRRRRRQRAESPADRVALAWTEAAESLTLLGRAPSPTDTPAEAAHGLADPLDDADAIAATHRLARLLEHTSYSASGADLLDAELAEECLDPIRAAVRLRLSRWDRARAALDPRSQLRQRAQDHRGRQRRITPATVQDDDVAHRESDRDLALTSEPG